ncbi:MAG TPA: mandelate racemase/muconate lactonizing enzyme family protein [Firmicutes bacterium]|nr:mandelate racemase/muconate lactonizing enzyme family protein [Bacillota bacterium]
MKITGVKAIPVSYPLVKPIWDAQHYIAARTAVLVRVETDAGLVGVGESACFGGHWETTATLVEKEIAPYYLGQDPFCVERLWDASYRGTIQHGRRGAVIAALSGVDIAVWDLVGKATGLALYKVLGGYAESIPAYASGGFYSDGKGPIELAQEVAGCLQQGFTAAKIKVGSLAWEEDLERVRAVRRAIGPHVPLMVDANSNWDVPTAQRAAHDLEEFNITWIEEPVCPDDVEGCARIAAGTRIPIAGFEQESTRFAFRNLICAKAVGIVQPDVTWAGGITECRRIAALAAAWNLPCVPHVFSTGVSLAANLHFIASIPNGRWLEYDCNPNPLREELIGGRLRIGPTGQVALPSEPGLGIELDEAILARYRLA